MKQHEMERLKLVDELPEGLIWRTSERFGPLATEKLETAQENITRFIRERGWTFDGWIATAGRSVVAAAQDQTVIVKAPLFDARRVIEAIRGYARTGTGPSVLGSEIGGLHGVVAMERITGRYFPEGVKPTLDELGQVIELSSRCEPAEGTPGRPYMSLEDRLSLELQASIRRSGRLNDTSALSTLFPLARKIFHAATGPMSPRHGDLAIRNVLHDNGRMQLIDPEPFMGPLEFDAAKLSISCGYDPALVAEHLNLDVELTVAIHTFLYTSGGLYLSVRASDLPQ